MFNELIIKNIPGCDESGVLDPKVYEVATNPDKYKFERTDVDKSFTFNNIPVGMIRSIMGWNNEDLTTTNISTEYKEIPGEECNIPVRIYSPQSDEKLPCFVFIHGGGFIGGGLDTVENPCKLIAERTPAVVVSVDYRLAPEAPYPKGFNDCFDVIKWVYNNGDEINVDVNRIGVGGDSAGGNLSAVCTLKDKDLKTNMIKYQALIYPAVTMSEKEVEYYKWDINEYEMNKDKEIIENMVCSLKDSNDMLVGAYLQNPAYCEDRYVSPLLADDLSGLPKTLVVVAEYDFLRVQGEAYAKKLIENNVDCRAIRYKGVDHAFIDKLGLYSQAEDCVNEIAKDLQSL